MNRQKRIYDFKRFMLRKCVMPCACSMLAFGVPVFGSAAAADTAGSEDTTAAADTFGNADTTAAADSFGSEETSFANPDGQEADAIRVSYLGPEGTYTEEAAKFFFSAGDFVPKASVTEAIADVMEGEADYAVIPQENTLGGAVTNYVDALIAEEDIYVVGEVILPINQTLMGLPGASLEDIRTVCSHAQGIIQSAEWRKEHLPDAATQEMSSTAAAAGYVAENGDKTIAAVAAPGAADLYGLEVLAENVQITDANKTRFYVLSSFVPEEDEAWTHAVFVACCEASRIDDIIVEIHDTGAELVTLHDRPEGSRLGLYNYIIEVTDEPGLSDEVLEAIASEPEVHFRGSFNAIEKESGGLSP